MELSKKDKKTSREIIDRGIQQEFRKALLESAQVLKEWETQKLDNKEAYHKLYKHVTDYDERIASFYDRISGSRYLNIIAIQYRDGFVTDDDIAALSDEANEYLARWRGVYEWAKGAK